MTGATRLHSKAHIEELAYTAIRKALFPAGFPVPRARDGRFISRTKATARRLREELQAQSNLTLSQAISRIQDENGERRAAQ